MKKFLFFILFISSLSAMAQSQVKMKLKANAIKATSAHFSWRTQNQYRGYRLEMHEVGKPEWQVAVLSTGDDYTVQNLKINTTYEFRLALIKNLNEGVANYSESITIKTKNADEEKISNKLQMPALALDAKLNAILPQIIDMQWSQQNFGYFRAEISQNGKTNWKEISATTENRISLPQQNSNTTLYIRIAASKYANAPIEAYSNVVSITTGENPVQKPKNNRGKN